MVFWDRSIYLYVFKIQKLHNLYKLCKMSYFHDYSLEEEKYIQIAKKQFKKQTNCNIEKT